MQYINCHGVPFRTGEHWSCHGFLFRCATEIGGCGRAARSWLIRAVWPCRCSHSIHFRIACQRGWLSMQYINCHGVPFRTGEHWSCHGFLPLPASQLPIRIGLRDPNSYTMSDPMTKKPKRANPKEPGRCIFCGQGGLTHEHIYADWLKDYIPREQPYHVMRKADVGPYSNETVELRKQTGDFYGRRVYCVCAPCNNEWMSRLQERVRPIVVPMLTGQAITLHRRAQTTLASWTAMMIMVGEYVNRDKIAIPQSDRAFLMETQKPPSHWRIWIGAHLNETFPAWTHNIFEFANKGEVVSPRARSETQNTHASTICIGKHLLVHAMSSIPARSIIRKWRLPEPVRSGLNQIWPIRDSYVDWSPELRLNDRGMDLLANDFMNSIHPA
jgi:hypothetical protein